MLKAVESCQHIVSLSHLIRAVRAIATAHDGTAEARPRADGGLTVQISLPH